MEGDMGMQEQEQKQLGAEGIEAEVDEDDEMEFSNEEEGQTVIEARPFHGDGEEGGESNFLEENETYERTTNGRSKSYVQDNSSGDMSANKWRSSLTPDDLEGSSEQERDAEWKKSFNANEVDVDGEFFTDSKKSNRKILSLQKQTHIEQEFRSYKRGSSGEVVKTVQDEEGEDGVERTEKSERSEEQEEPEGSQDVEVFDGPEGSKEPEEPKGSQAVEKLEKSQDFDRSEEFEDLKRSQKPEELEVFQEPEELEIPQDPEKHEGSLDLEGLDDGEGSQRPESASNQKETTICEAGERKNDFDPKGGIEDEEQRKETKGEDFGGSRSLLKYHSTPRNLPHLDDDEESQEFQSGRVTSTKLNEEPEPIPEADESFQEPEEGDDEAEEHDGGRSAAQKTRGVSEQEPEAAQELEDAQEQGYAQELEDAQAAAEDVPKTEGGQEAEDAQEEEDAQKAGSAEAPEESVPESEVQQAELEQVEDVQEEAEGESDSAISNVKGKSRSSSPWTVNRKNKKSQ